MPGQSITTEAQSMTLYDPIAIVLHSAQNEFYAQNYYSPLQPLSREEMKEQATKALGIAQNRIQSINSDTRAVTIMNVSEFFGSPIGTLRPWQMEDMLENGTRDSKNLMDLIETIGQKYCMKVWDLHHYFPEEFTQFITTRRSKTLLRISALVSIANALSTGVARAARKAVRDLRGSRDQIAIVEMARSVISANAEDFIRKCAQPSLVWMEDEAPLRSVVMSTKLFRRNHQYTALIAGKAKEAIQAITQGAIQSIVDATDPQSDPSSDEDRINPDPLPRRGRFTGEDSHLSSNQRRTDWWIRLSKRALSRYSQESASLTIAALESFILHLQSGGQEGGTACLFLKEEFDESSFELGPNSTIRRIRHSGNIEVKYGTEQPLVFKEQALMEEAGLRGSFDCGETSLLATLQALLHDLMLDSTDAITSIQYLGGSEVHEYSHESSWDDGRALLIQRFLSAFTPNGIWDDCSFRHALRDKRRPGLQFDFHLRTTLKSITASLGLTRKARLQWRWSARSSATLEGDTIVANGLYTDTIVLVKGSIYIAERVTHGTSVVQQELWRTTPWRPVQPAISLIALERELDRLNRYLFRLQESRARSRSLLTFKLMGVPLVAFASFIAAINGIIAANGAAQLSLGIFGLVVAFAAFLISFLDGIITWQSLRTAKRISGFNKASLRYEGALDEEALTTENNTRWRRSPMSHK